MDNQYNFKKIINSDNITIGNILIPDYYKDKNTRVNDAYQVIARHEHECHPCELLQGERDLNMPHLIVTQFNGSINYYMRISDLKDYHVHIPIPPREVLSKPRLELILE